MRHGVGALFKGHLHLGFGEHGPGEGSSQEVLTFVDRARLDGFPQVAGYELLAQVFNENFAAPLARAFWRTAA